MQAGSELKLFKIIELTYPVSHTCSASAAPQMMKMGASFPVHLIYALGLESYLDITKAPASAKTTNGNKYLKSALVEAAHFVAASKNCLGAMYRRTAARNGKKRAAIDAHAMLRIAYYLLTRKEMYVDLGED